MSKSYRDLEVYKRSYRLALEIHRFSLILPDYLRYDLADQIRRASRSVPSQIAEGYARDQSNKEKIKFLRIALGSNDEMLFNLNFMKDSELIAPDQFDYFYREYTVVGKQLFRLIQYLTSN